LLTGVKFEEKNQLYYYWRNFNVLNEKSDHNESIHIQDDPFKFALLLKPFNFRFCLVSNADNVGTVAIDDKEGKDADDEHQRNVPGE
jgi:hypothetical protein